jgi:hypothetical protein
LQLFTTNRGARDPAALAWLNQWRLGAEKTMQDIEHMEGYDELMAMIRDSLTVEERLFGLTPEQRLAGLGPEERLAGLGPEERLAGLGPEERLAGLGPEERLAGLGPEERLAGLSPEQLERLRALLVRRDQE